VVVLSILPVKKDAYACVGKLSTAPCTYCTSNDAACRVVGNGSCIHAHHLRYAHRHHRIVGDLDDVNAPEHNMDCECRRRGTSIWMHCSVSCMSQHMQPTWAAVGYGCAVKPTLQQVTCHGASAYWQCWSGWLQPAMLAAFREAAGSLPKRG
jgi:hypothetical protein